MLICNYFCTFIFLSFKHTVIGKNLVLGKLVVSYFVCYLRCVSIYIYLCLYLLQVQECHPGHTLAMLAKTEICLSVVKLLVRERRV